MIPLYLFPKCRIREVYQNIRPISESFINDFDRIQAFIENQKDDSSQKNFSNGLIKCFRALGLNTKQYDKHFLELKQRIARKNKFLHPVQRN